MTKEVELSTGEDSCTCTTDARNVWSENIENENMIPRSQIRAKEIW